MLNPRYLIRGIMDGSISTLGVVIGAFNPNVSIIIAAGAAGAVANGLSNILAAFTAEYTGSYQALRELEEATLTPMAGTIQERRLRFKMMRDALYDGTASIAGGMVPLIPFFIFEGLNALLWAVAVCCLLMGTIGVWIGHLTKKNLLYSFVKLIVITLVTALLCTLIHHSLLGVIQ